MIPSVAISKTDGHTGVIKPGNEGIVAIIAASSAGTANRPEMITKQSVAQTDFGYGPLPEAAAYIMSVSGNPVVLVKSTGTTAGAYGSVSHTGAGSSVCSAGATAPYDDYDVIVSFVAGGTIGIAGATYKYTLDGGNNWSGVIALGTANTITIPNSGVELDFGAGTLLAGQTEEVVTTAPQTTNTDLVNALEALRVSSLGFETILVSGDATGTLEATLAAWITAREAEGRYYTGFVNSIAKGSTAEATFLTNMGTAWNASSSTSMSVGADYCAVTSGLTGLTLKRPVALVAAARDAKIDISRDAAYIADGPVPGVTIADARGNPLYHDELMYPGLDAIRLVTLRSVPGYNGVYITNPNLISPSGSDYVYRQHVRCMNKACSIAFQVLTNQLSKGVQKNATTGFILEPDAKAIEVLVQSAIDRELVTPKRVSACVFTLSRTDDLSANGGATVNGTIDMIALAYIKKFAIEARFTKTIAVSA